jgi:hypothetical protein
LFGYTIKATEMHTLFDVKHRVKPQISCSSELFMKGRCGEGERERDRGRERERETERESERERRRDGETKRQKYQETSTAICLE